MEMSSGAAYPAGANPYYAMPPQCGYPMQPPPAVPPSSSSDGAPQGSVPYGAELPSMPAGEGGGDSKLVADLCKSSASGVADYCVVCRHGPTLKSACLYVLCQPVRTVDDDVRSWSINSES